MGLVVEEEGSGGGGGLQGTKLPRADVRGVEDFESTQGKMDLMRP